MQIESMTIVENNEDTRMCLYFTNINEYRNIERILPFLDRIKLNK